MKANKQSSKKPDQTPAKPNVSLTIKRVAMAYSSGMYTSSMIPELLADEGFTNSEAEEIMNTAVFLQESMYDSLKSLAGIARN